MTLTNNVVAKIAVAFVAVAMMFSAVAPVAQAANVSDMSLDQLIALVTQLQAQLGQGATTGTTGGSCEAIAAPLTMGAQGAAVTALQNRLIAAGQVIPAGATGYFGGQTQSALAAWQAANGVTPAVGYYGPITAAAMAAKCVPATETETETETETGSATLSGEAILSALSIDSASDDEVEEGAEDAEIAEVTFEFEDGDAEISRLDIAIDNGGVDMWDVLDEVTLWIDGDEVAKMDASDEDNYQSDEVTLRFSGLDIVAMEDEEVEMTIAVTLQGNIDSDDLSLNSGNFTVSVDAIRYFDADGVATTEDADFDLTDDVIFTVVEAGADDELIARSSSADPESMTMKVETNKKSSWFSVFTFDLDTKDSTNDIDLNEIVVNLATDGNVAGNAGYDDLVDDVELVIDGVTIDDVNVTGVTASEGTAILTFDVDGDVTIDAGDRVEVELMVRFKALPTGEEGATVRGSISSLDTTIVDAEGADDLGNGQLSGAATGKLHTLRTTGMEVELADASAVVTAPNDPLNDYATYTLELDVTAFEQDVYIDVDDTNSLVWDLTTSSGASVSFQPASTSVTMSSTGEEVAGYYEITEGSTETITIVVTYTPSLANTAARLQLTSIEFDNNTTAGGEATWLALPATTYRTAVKTMVN